LREENNREVSNTEACRWFRIAGGRTDSMESAYFEPVTFTPEFMT